MWLTSIVARETGSIAITDCKHIDRNSNLLTTAVTLAARTEEASCGKFGTSQHCHAAGHSLPDSSNMIRWSDWDSPYLAALGGDLQFRCPTDAVPERRQLYGDEGKAVGMPKPRRLCCLCSIAMGKVIKAARMALVAVPMPQHVPLFGSIVPPALHTSDVSRGQWLQAPLRAHSATRCLHSSASLGGITKNRAASLAVPPPLHSCAPLGHKYPRTRG